MCTNFYFFQFQGNLIRQSLFYLKSLCSYCWPNYDSLDTITSHLDFLFVWRLGAIVASASGLLGLQLFTTKLGLAIWICSSVSFHNYPMPLCQWLSPLRSPSFPLLLSACHYLLTPCLVIHWPTFFLFWINVLALYVCCLCNLIFLKYHVPFFCIKTVLAKISNKVSKIFGKYIVLIFSNF